MPNPFTKPKKTPEQMAADLAELRITAAGLLRTYDELALAAADGADQGAADKAHAALVAHRQIIARAEGVLEAIERRAQREQMDAAAKSVDGAWAATMAASKERIDLARHLANSLKVAGDAFAKLTAANTAVQRALPAARPHHAGDSFAFDAALLPAFLALEMSRVGLPGGPALAGFVPPPMEQRYAEATMVIAQHRAAAREPAPKQAPAQDEAA
jgi:hypothetical protein